MERVSYLVDTDVLIDWLQGRQWAKALLRSDNTRLYCSSVTRKELYDKPGISDTERRHIRRLLQIVRVLTAVCLLIFTAHSLTLASWI